MLIIEMPARRSHRDFKEREAETYDVNDYVAEAAAVIAISKSVRRPEVCDNEQYVARGRSHRDFKEREAGMSVVYNPPGPIAAAVIAISKSVRRDT